MKRFLLTGIGLLLLFMARAQSSRHVILVTIDGLRPEFYQSDTFSMPNVRRLMKLGAYAKKVTDVFPAVTYPNHTSIITGALPVHHGIYCNEPFEPDGITGKWFWFADAIRCPTLFDAVRAQGGKTAAVFWPVQVGAKIDYNVPDIWDPKSGERLAPAKQYVTPTGLWQEIEENATGKFQPGDLDEARFSFDENSTRMASYLLKTYKPELTALHLICTDDMQHAEGTGGYSVKLAVANADHCIGQLLEAIDRAGISDSTTLIITGDHGFESVSRTISPNIWLAKADLINGKDWRAKFQSGRGSGFLRLNTAGLNRTQQKTVLAQVRSVLDQLPDSLRHLFSVLNKEELNRLGAYPDASLAIVPIDGVTIAPWETGAEIRPSANKGTHGYLPDNPKMKTGFIAYGAGIRQGIVIEDLRTIDIAPLIAQLLRIDFKAPDGKLVPGILK